MLEIDFQCYTKDLGQLENGIVSMRSEEKVIQEFDFFIWEVKSL